jgi:Fe-S-cluster containining protein
MIEKNIEISDSLGGLIKQMDGQQVQIVRDMFQHYMEQYSELRTKHNAETVVSSIHDLIDQAMKELEVQHPNNEISCKAGCSFCCYQRVDISDDEATLLLAYAREIGYEIDYSKLERQSKAKDEKEYMKLRPRHRRCVFLNEENECGVYQHRPSACRKLVVISDPNLCDTVANKGAEVGRLVSLEAEVVTSSSLNVRESGSMAEMILKQKK